VVSDDNYNSGGDFGDGDSVCDFVIGCFGDCGSMCSRVHYCSGAGGGHNVISDSDKVVDIKVYHILERCFSYLWSKWSKSDI
jgi:hypothetical protein